MPAQTTWNGDRIKRNVSDAIRLGTSATAAACVAPAQAETPVDTGTARSSVSFREAQRQDTRWVAEFGSYNVAYYIWLEIGARGRAGGYMLRRAVDQQASKEQIIRRIKGFL